MALAARPSDWTHEQFIEWWRGEHTAVTYPLPGLLRCRDPGSADERSAGRDGLPVLGFASREALCPQWQAAVAHVGSMRGRRMLWFGDEKTMVPLTDPAR